MQLLNGLSRTPQLFYGNLGYSRKLAGHARLAENLYVFLHVSSYFLLLLTGILGYAFYQFYGLLISAAAGYAAGAWMRRSLGVRGRKSTTGYFLRMRERAQGSKPGLLEGLLEKLGQTELSQAKCKAIIQVYDTAVKQLKQARSTSDQNNILADLDRRVWEISYG
ncbi:MAG TPA: hypothetical protein VF498_01695 [Anaerolineales bacterium]